MGGETLGPEKALCPSVGNARARKHSGNQSGSSSAGVKDVSAELSALATMAAFPL